MAKHSIIKGLKSKLEIIDYLYRNDIVLKICHNIHDNKDHFNEDIAQDVAIILLEKDEAKIMDMYDKNVLIFYIVRTVMNCIVSKKPLYRDIQDKITFTDDCLDRINLNNRQFNEEEQW